jgi:hypothetical protein
MTPEQVRAMLFGGDIAPPFTIHTTGGRSYPVADIANIWSPPTFPDTAVIVIPRQALAILRLELVDRITCEEHTHG